MQCEQLLWWWQLYSNSIAIDTLLDKTISFQRECWKGEREGERIRNFYSFFVALLSVGENSEVNILNSNRLLFSLSFNVHRRRHHRRSIICLEFSCPPFSFIFPFFFNGERKREREREREEREGPWRKAAKIQREKFLLTTNHHYYYYYQQQREAAAVFYVRFTYLVTKEWRKKQMYFLFSRKQESTRRKKQREEQRQLIAFCVHMQRNLCFYSVHFLQHAFYSYILVVWKDVWL